MSRNPIRKAERDKLIKEMYNKYAAEHITGSRGQKIAKYRHEAMLELVGKKFFLEPGTIGNIIIQPDEEDKDQLDLFSAE